MVALCVFAWVGRVCPVLRAPVWRLGERDAEPTKGDEGQGNATSIS